MSDDLYDTPLEALRERVRRFGLRLSVGAGIDGKPEFKLRRRRVLLAWGTVTEIVCFLRGYQDGHASGSHATARSYRDPSMVGS